MKYKNIFFLVTGLIVSINCSGQDSVSKPVRSYPNNSLFIELGGNVLAYGSLNYERIFFHKDFLYLSGRIGIGYECHYDGWLLTQSRLSFQVLVNGIFQVHRWLAFEVGIGASLVRFGGIKYDYHGGHSDEYFYGPWLTGVCGVRIQLKNGFLLRFTLTPLYDINKMLTKADVAYFQFWPWAGVSIGGSFGKKKK